MIRLILFITILTVATYTSYAKDFLDAGNRYVAGKFDLKAANKYSVKLGHIPVRIKATIEAGTPTIYTLSDNGQIYKTSLKSDKPTTIKCDKQRDTHSTLRPVVNPSDASKQSAPVWTTHGLIYVNDKGNAVVRGKVLDIDAAKDNEIAVASNIAVVLIQPTTSYAHGVLGDNVESNGFAVIDLKNREVIAKKLITEIGVIEQKGVLLADLDADGIVEIVVTISNDTEGARVNAYGLDGQLKYAGTPINHGYRWRHVFFAAADFGSGVRIANVITPHIGGTLEFLEAKKNDILRRTTSTYGFSSHSIGSANLGMGLAVDTDGDSLPEVMVPEVNKRVIKIINGNGKLKGNIGLDSKLSTEITGLSIGSDVRMIAFGTNVGSLHIYLK